MNRWPATVLLLVPIVLVIVLVCADQASAGIGELVRVLELSPGGYERAHALAFSPDGKFLAVGGTSGIYLVDPQDSSTPEFIRTGVWARSLIFLPSSHTLAAGLFDSTIRLWSIPDLQLRQTIDDPDGWVRSISISQDGSLLASASDDNKIRIWRTDTAELILVLNDVSATRAVALSPDGTRVAGALSDNSVRVWSVSNGELLYILAGHTDWPRALAFSPDGRLLASGGFDKIIQLWDIADGGIEQTLTGHTSSVLGLAFSPDGQTLASGSVDQTVLIWQVDDPSPKHILQGHSDFVYAVAFSPDGRTLASGSGDNTVRLWDLQRAAEVSSGEVPETASDCRQCHHRRGQNDPARVIDLSCEACHPGGIGLSWCTAFPRSTAVEDLPAQYQSTHDVSGVPVNDEKIAIILASPGNGETFYVMQGFMAPEIISGKVYYPDREMITSVQVQLDIISDGRVTASLITSPTESGDFNFNVAINPDSPPAYSSKPATRQCIICHDDSLAVAGVPTGTINFVVTATAPDGAQAADERWARIDASGEAILPVRLVDEETGQPLAGLIVEASTILYEWRDRYGSGLSDPSGITSLRLERLSQAPTIYEISVQPQILNGSLYLSPRPAAVTLDPFSASHPMVTVPIRSMKGRINGFFNRAIPSGDLDIRGILLPGGPVYRASVADGRFAFEDLPIGRYVLAIDPFLLGEQRLHTDALSIDLYESTEADASFVLTDSQPISGVVRPEEGGFLPFAWISFGDQGNVRAVDTVSGKYLLPVHEAHRFFVTAAAPGYYSLSESISSLNEDPDFQLVARPDTQSMAWGDGKITLPPETKALVNASGINLEQGWLWGENNVSAQTIQINLSGIEIRIRNGKFALEYPAHGTGWLYVYRGEANILHQGSQSREQIQDGEMIALVDGAGPLLMESAVTMALHPPLDEAPVFEMTEPSLGAKILNRLAKAGIGLMQMITFITYILSLVTLIGIISHTLFLRRKKSPPTEEKS